MNRGFPDYNELDVTGDFIEDYDETQTLSKKDWFKPASVSLARLDKVKPVATVYNIAPRDPRDLQAARGKTTVVPSNDHLSDLQTEPPLSTVSYQKAAWGSQTSIPELLKQAAQAGTKPSRPSSAKTGSVTKPQPSRKSRPQSAKDPLFPTGKKKTSALGIKGQKFDPSERSAKYGVPPGGNCVGWAGPPAGLCEPPVNNINGSVQSANANLPKSHAPPPPPPNTSPEPADADNMDMDAQPVSPPPSPGLCLSLSLPSADVDAADEPDTGRLLDEADKFVKKQKKKESQKIKFFKADAPGPGSISEALKSSLSTSQQNCTPIPENSGIDDQVNIARSASPLDAFISKVKQTDEEGNKTKSLDCETSQEINFSVEEDVVKGPTVTELSLNLEEPSDKEKTSEKPLPPSNGFDLEYLGPARQEKKTRSHPIFLLPDKVSPLMKEPGNHSKRPQNDKHRTASDEDKMDAKLKEKDRAVTHPSTESKVQQKNDTHAGNLRSAVHICEDRNITVDITPRNLGRKVTGKSHRKNRMADDLEIRNGVPASGKPFSREEVPDLEVTSTLGKSRDLSPSGRSSTSAATVSVVYDDDDDSQTSVNKKKKKTRRRPIKEKDIVTMVSNISLSDEDDDDDDPSKEMDIEIGDDKDDQNHEEMARSSSALSRGERNYYDISRKQTRGNALESAASLEEKENFITMTTKTILFDLEKPQESVVKTILDAPLSKQRERGTTVTPVKPTTVRPRSANRPRSAKLTKSNLHCLTPVNNSPPPKQNLTHSSCGDGGFTASTIHQELFEEERPESRMGFVPMEPDRVKTDCQDTSLISDTKEQRFSQRPPSGRRRPLSAAVKTVNRPGVLSSRQTAQSAKTSVMTKQRPQSASSVTARSPSVAEVQRANAAAQALRCERETTVKSSTSSRFTDSRRHYASYARSGQRQARSASLSRKPVQINSNPPDFEEEDTEAMEECRDIQKRLAHYGIDVKPQTLERALFPPTGKTLYYQLDAQLPKSYTNGLLSHPRYWLPEEHKRLKLAEKKLAMAELSLWRQKKEEERKARLAAGKKVAKKGKKKGKKKLRRSQSIC